MTDPEVQAVAGTIAMDRVAAAAERRARPIYRAAAAELLDLMRSAPSFESIRHRLTPHASPLTGLGDLLHGLLVTGNLAGRATLFEQAREQTKRALAFAEGDLPEGFDFEPLDPADALRYFRQRVPVSDSAFRALNATMKTLAFRIAGVEDAALIEAVNTKLEAAVKGELTLGEFLRDAPTIFEAYGITETSPHHLETMFRTNTLTALNAGKWDEAQDEDLQDLFPLYRYSAILDDRSRPQHAAMHGHTAPIDDAFWSTWWPPNGFNCRCTAVPLSTVYVRKHRITASRRPSPTVQPDPGFRTNPKAALEAWSDAA